MIALAVGFLVSLIVTLILIRFQHIHGHLTADYDLDSIQKFHSKPVPRIGGIGIIVGALLALMVKYFAESPQVVEKGILILAAAVPVFLAGLLEDVTKRIGIRIRLAAAFGSALLAGIFAGAWVLRFDIPYLDNLFYEPQFFIGSGTICVTGILTFFVTVIAVGGVTNSFNLIDGYNGLTSVTSILILLGILYVSKEVDDREIIVATLAFLGAIGGFAVWNYPHGHIFLGDSGAYLIGFVVAELSVLLVARNHEVSPWFPLLLSLYPIFETLFTIYRRLIIGGRNPGHPDAAHLHQLVYRRLVRWAAGPGYDRHLVMTLRNALTSPYLWVMTSFAVLPAVLFWRETPLLVLCTVIYLLFYIQTYRMIIRRKFPKCLQLSKARPHK